jgi:hypothetical protein
MKPRISMITLGVDEAEKSVAFYRDGSWFSQLNSSSRIAFFSLSFVAVWPYGRMAVAEDVQLSGQ